MVLGSMQSLRSRAPELGALVLVAAITLLAAGCGDETLTVPKVTGQDSDVFHAYKDLSDAGFTVEITDGFETGPFCMCENPVAEQWPPPGTRAKRGSVVEITVGGPGFLGSFVGRQLPYDRNLRLPKLVGLRLDRADRWLSRHNIGWTAELTRLPATSGDDLLDAYIVTAQKPGVGSRVRRSPPSVSLEAGPSRELLAEWHGSTVVIPHVSGGRDLPSAYDRLHARGLRVATNRRLSHGPYIPVVSQEPRAGTKVDRGTTVRLVLDPKVEKRTVCCDIRPRLAMPSVVGRNLGDVAEWLDRLSLAWELVDAPALPATDAQNLFDPYVVTSQKPAVGTTIPESIPARWGDELKPIELRAKLAAR
jgi:beta-lactam-binding protein with PASTA domain